MDKHTVLGRREERMSLHTVLSRKSGGKYYLRVTPLDHYNERAHIVFVSHSLFSGLFLFVCRYVFFFFFKKFIS